MEHIKEPTAGTPSGHHHHRLACPKTKQLLHGRADRYTTLASPLSSQQNALRGLALYCRYPLSKQFICTSTLAQYKVGTQLHKSMQPPCSYTSVCSWYFGVQLVPGTSLHNGGNGALAVHYPCTNAAPVPAAVGAYAKVLIAYPLVVAALPCRYNGSCLEGSRARPSCHSRTAGSVAHPTRLKRSTRRGNSWQTTPPGCHQHHR